MKLSGLYQIDGMDLWDTFGIGVESGSDDFLKIPERKDSITHDWLDEDGLEVDLSRTFFKARDVVLKCWATADTKESFFTRYYQLITVFRKPGLRRLSVARHQKDYFVFYKDNNAMQSFNFTVLSSGKVFTKFSLTVNETKPSFQAVQTFLVDEQNRFIII
jgi:hypothetical protein